MNSGAGITGSGSGGYKEINASLGQQGSGVSKSQQGQGTQKEQMQAGMRHMEIHPPNVMFSDMKIEMQKFAFEKATEAFKMMLSREKQYFKDMAQYIKAKFDENYSPSWHVIIGREFGSFFSYENGCCIQFWVNHICFLIYKFG